MSLGIVRIINSQPVFSNPKDDNVEFRITNLSLQLVSSQSLMIPYTIIDNIIIDGDIFTINLNKTIDTQLGSTSFLTLMTNNETELLKYVMALGKKNHNITVHSVDQFAEQDIDNDVTNSFMNLSLDLPTSSSFFSRIDSYPSSVFNCNVYITLTPTHIHFHNRREYDLQISYSNIRQIDVFNSGLYLYTKQYIKPFDNQNRDILVIYTPEPQTLFTSIKSYIE